MTLPFPYPVRGYVYDSNNDILPGVDVVLTYSSYTLIVTSDANGRYVANIMNYADSGCTMVLNTSYEGERDSTSFKVNLSLTSINYDSILKESMNTKGISLNTSRKYGNKVYIFSPWTQESWCKTMDV